MDQKQKLFVDLPLDVLFQVFSGCCVLEVLRLSFTCKRLQRIADEYQVWLDQARCLQIPIPPGTTPSKAELKDWTIPPTRVEVCWTKSRPGDLSLNLLETDRFIDAHFIPGGEFVVLLYRNGDVGLSKIERSAVSGGLKAQEVARCKETNRDHFPGSYSRLLTETSYGCPVLVWMEPKYFRDPEIFAIDPASQVIDRKQDTRCNFNANTYFRTLKISAIKNRMFFIYENERGATRLIVVEEPGPNVVKKRFRLAPPTDYDTFEVQFFAITEDCFATTNRHEIRLYHIPELEAVDEDTGLTPVWNRPLGASGCSGSLFKTVSPYPVLWLQGERVTHMIEFDVDESGFYPVVVNHQITKGQPEFFVGDTLKLQGRKGISTETGWVDEIVINTGMVGKPNTRRLRAPIPGLNRVLWFARDEVSYTSLDEVTGRIMVVVSYDDALQRTPHARKLKLYVADLPI